jgi:hypothetical protein
MGTAYIQAKLAGFELVAKEGGRNIKFGTPTFAFLTETPDF